MIEIVQSCFVAVFLLHLKCCSCGSPVDDAANEVATSVDEIMFGFPEGSGPVVRFNDSWQADAELRATLLRGYQRYASPWNRNHSTPLFVKLLALSTTFSVDEGEHEQTLSLHGFVRMAWKDPRLTWASTEYLGISRIVMPEEQIWVPDLQLLNGPTRNSLADVEHFKHSTVRVDDDGSVIMMTKFSWTAECVFDYTNYPHDEQSCSFWLGCSDGYYSASELHLQFLPQGWYAPKGIRLWSPSQAMDMGNSFAWTILHDRTQTQDMEYSSPYESQDFMTRALLAEVFIQRNHSNYVYSFIVMPLSATATLTMLSFGARDCGMRLVLLTVNVGIEILHGLFLAGFALPRAAYQSELFFARFYKTNIGLTLCAMVLTIITMLISSCTCVWTFPTRFDSLLRKIRRRLMMAKAKLWQVFSPAAGDRYRELDVTNCESSAPIGESAVVGNGLCTTATTVDARASKRNAGGLVSWPFVAKFVDTCAFVLFALIYMFASSSLRV